MASHERDQVMWEVVEFLWYLAGIVGLVYVFMILRP